MPSAVARGSGLGEISADQLEASDTGDEVHVIPAGSVENSPESAPAHLLLGGLDRGATGSRDGLMHASWDGMRMQLVWSHRCITGCSRVVMEV